jgi:CrcB protein
MTWLAVAVGGALGSLMRYGVSAAALRGWLGPVASSGMPLATLLVNTLGCLLIGLLWGWQSQQPTAWSPALRGAVFSGMLGGFTTFSTFSLESLQLIRDGQQALAIGYMAGSLLLGLGAAGAGLWLNQRLVG